MCTPKKSIFSLSVILTLASLSCSLSFLHPESAEEEKYINPFVEEITERNLQIFKKRLFNWSAHGFREWIEKLLERGTWPNEAIRRKYAHEFFQTFKDYLPTKVGSIVDTNTWEDLNLFCGAADKTKYLGSQFSRTSTELGEVMLYCMLADPKICEDGLRVVSDRQNAIRAFLDCPEIEEELTGIFVTLAKPEHATVSLFSEVGFERPAERKFFKAGILKKLNRYPIALQVHNLVEKQGLWVGLGLQAFASALLPAYGASAIGGHDMGEWLATQAERRRDYGNPLFQCLSLFVNIAEKLRPYRIINGLVSFVVGAYSYMSLPDRYQWSCDTSLLEKAIQTKLIEVAKYVRGMKEVHEVVSQYPELTKAIPSFDLLTESLVDSPQKFEELQKTFELLSSSTFRGEASYASYTGRILATFHLVHKVKELLKPGMYAIAELDALLSCARLMKEHANKPAHYCFVDFEESMAPHIILEDFWNPFIGADDVVINSLELGATARRNGVITGPNAGGKSTTIKGIAINLILAQTFGIAAAKRMVLTPFTRIATYLNITDDIGVGNSLFQSEVLRAQQLLDTVKSLKEGEFSFTAIDEMFSGTSPVEGEAAAYSVAKHLAQFGKSIAMVATHHAMLTKLEEETESFTNYKVSVDVSEYGISYPYKLETGISHQNIAIDILRDQGFDGEILETAEGAIAR